MKAAFSHKETDFHKEIIWKLICDVLAREKPVDELLINPIFTRRVRRICNFTVGKNKAQALYDAEDLYQDVCLKIFSHINGLKHIDDERIFFGWVARIARNHLIDIGRRDNKEIVSAYRRGDAVVSIDSIVKGDNIAAASEDYVELEYSLKEALASLSERQFQILELKTNGLTLREIAEEVGCSRSTVHNEVIAALRIISDCINIPTVKRSKRRKRSYRSDYYM